MRAWIERPAWGRRATVLLATVAILTGNAECVLERDDLNERFARANRHYAAQEFEQARDLYERLAEEAVAREVFYNLGNCHFQLGQMGRACLAYRRALLTDAGMTEARQNLHLLQSKLGFLQFQSSGLRQAVEWLTRRQWVVVSAFGFWFFALGTATLLVFRPSQPFGGGIVALAICGVLFGWVGAWAADFHRKHLSPDQLAIVVEEGTVALTGPFPDAKPVMSLPAGSELKIEAQRDQWLFVYVPGDSAGWIEASAAEPLWPSGFSGSSSVAF